MLEIWKDIKNFEGSYQISNTGKVKSLKRDVFNGCKFITRPERIIKFGDNGHGYLFVSLWKNNKPTRMYVHKLVAEAFIPNPNNYKEINHKDENKANNNVYNLEWCDRKYNENYKTKRIRGAIENSKPIVKIIDKHNIIIYLNEHIAAKYNNCNVSTIRRYVRLEYKYSNMFRYAFTNEATNIKNKNVNILNVYNDKIDYIKSYNNKNKRISIIRLI